VERVPDKPQLPEELPVRVETVVVRVAEVPPELLRTTAQPEVVE
jgi:hypothetical protein